MNDDSNSFHDHICSTWRSRANWFRRGRVTHSRRMRQAVVSRVRHGDPGQDNRDIKRQLRQAWESLDSRLPRVAQTLDLHYVSGYSIDDVASILGRSLQTSVLDLRLGNAWLARAVERDLG